MWPFTSKLLNRAFLSTTVSRYFAKWIWRSWPGVKKKLFNCSVWLIVTYLIFFLQNNYAIRTHRTQKERCLAASELAAKLPGCPVVVDTMLDAANIAYGALPIRFHIIQDGRVVYEGGPGPMGYDMRGVRHWLENNCNTVASWVNWPDWVTRVLHPGNVMRIGALLCNVMVTSCYQSHRVTFFQQLQEADHISCSGLDV